MPPRKRAQTKPTTRAARRSKLAQENDISAQNEAEIRDAWNMFAVNDVDVEGFEEEMAKGGTGVMRTEDVRRAMKAQGIPPKDAQELTSFLSILDPDSTGYVTYANFLAICALKINARSDDSRAEEVETAYKLFTRGGEGPITIAHLRRVAKELKLKEDEMGGGEMLRNMILEANGGAGVSKGVGLEEFEGVMRRAGVF